MINEFKALIQAAKEYKEYQSLGNGAKLNCAIEAAELTLQQPDFSKQLLPCGEYGCQNPHERVYRGCDLCKFNISDKTKKVSSESAVG